MSQIFVGCALYYLWQVVPINNYKKTDDDGQHLPISRLKGPVSTYGVVLTSVGDMQ